MTSFNERLVQTIVGVQLTSPMDVVRLAMELADTYPTLTGKEKKAHVIAALEAIAAGKDGVAGTVDDLIPERVMRGVKALLSDEDLLRDTIDLVIAATKGHLDLNKAGSVTQRCVGVLVALCSPPHAK